MGALAPVSSWSPEDDLLLKNAVEAGASLESLAKGAVQFSRKFTIRELQERWRALLYDPVVSAEASFRMIELERSASVLPLKFNKAGNSKVNKSSSGKRKAESLRSSYYALRRRIQNESFGSMDLGFLGPHNSSNYIDGAADPLSGSCILQDPISNQSGLQESKLDAFPQILVNADVTTGDGVATHVFHTGVKIPVEGDFPMEQDTIQQELPAQSLYGADNSSMKPLSTFDEINGDPGNVCTEFERKQVFNSPVPACDASFQNLDYSSPLPEMPIWRAAEGISAAAIAVDVDLREKDMHAGETFSLGNHGDTENTTTLGYPDLRMNSKLKQQMLCDESKSPSASTELDLVELSNSLLYFSNDDELDKSYYDGVSSLLLSSPANVDEDGMPDRTEPGASVTPDCIPNQPGACPGELNDNQELQCGNNIVCNSEVQLPSSVSVSNMQFTAMIDGVICCMLNTEDPEIPCNDDVTFPNRLHSSSVSSVARRNIQADNKKFASAKVVPSNQKTSEGGSALMQRDLKNPSPSHTSFHISEAQLMPGALHRRVGDCGVKFEVPNKDSTHVTTSCVANACGSSAQIPSANFNADTCLPAALKDEITEFAVLQHLDKRSIDSFMEKPTIGSDSFTRYHHSHASDIKQELDETVYQVSDANMGSVYVAATEHCAEPPTSDLKELAIENDEDVPCFSDVEAMILDMDLEPEDQDLYSNEEVSRYQHEDATRAIIRLEQGAGSYMQRAIASHGALAILYGRRSKYYIKKPEVVLGRATEDLTVDIDLAREGRANTISRRQASISLGTDGSFSLKNLGKCSIFVNGKEVVAGKSLGLSHSCLIEIRGMPFIFELNQSRVERYLGGITKTNQAQEHQV